MQAASTRATIRGRLVPLALAGLLFPLSASSTPASEGALYLHALEAIQEAWRSWPPYRLHPDYAARLGAIRTVGVVTPVVRSFQGLARPVPRPDWAERVRGNLLASVEGALRKRTLAVKRIDPGAEGSSEELRDVLRLYEAVGSAIVEALYAGDFPAKKGRGFDYSVGDIGALLAAEGLDALVFTHATTHNETFGELPDRVYVGMIDRSGDVVWFTHDKSTNTDLRDPEDADLFAKNLIGFLPRTAR